MIGIGRCTGFRTMISQDMMIVISRIEIGRTIIERMIAIMITGVRIVFDLAIVIDGMIIEGMSVMTIIEEIMISKKLQKGQSSQI